MGFDVLYIIYSLHPSPPLGHGSVTHFSEGLYRMVVGQIWILGVTISHFSTSNFLVAFICYLYSCFSWYIIPPNILFCRAKKYFASYSQGLEKVQISWTPPVLQLMYFPCQGGSQANLFHRAIKDESCKLKNS